LACRPIAWWNDDLPELSDDVSLENACGNRAAPALPAWKKAAASRRSRVMLPILRAPTSRFAALFSGQLVDEELAANKDRIAP